jgi:hypothetical protein
MALERRPARQSAPLPPAARKALVAAVGGTVGTGTTRMPLDLARAIALSLRLRQR